MLGKSAGTGALGLSALLALSCAHMVSQDAATGPDGKTKGARPISLENGEGKSVGIVTYPGGDRVDWKVLELPDKATGDIDFELRWTPPRRGLQLAFDVFDQWGQPIVTSKKTGKKKHGRVRTATVEKAKGKYLVRVYAVGRGDAGKYTLTVNFHESADTKIDWAKVDIPDPPRLAAIPEDPFTCDDTNFDPKRLECKSYCPASPPPNWVGCKGKCPEPPDPNNKACWDRVCPTPPTTESRMCMSNPKKYFPPCPDPNNPDLDNPNCPRSRSPVTTRVVNIAVQGSDVLVTIPIGSEKGVTTDWKGQILRGSSDTPLDGGEVVIVRVTNKASLGKVHLTADQINANQKIKLIPPAVR
jgi:hypothetical protein